ncbi:cupin domain-containing protein [Paenibacillus roseipurpureus]|uniref:Cupin domain-containing protein n=1 Tax=Paenibacillus roseopurpureus TaxID=2918901 RepID=A0AA96RL31_9BACL|nr:cupin domain-containing protein [Paenibacillus sp. MBLB1832]WNR42697.1 cupin domain-containing protein [Paenibacillus sp. MBLB1832]
MAMILTQQDEVIRVNQPNYNDQNPVMKLLQLVESTHFAASLECYNTESLQYLFPFDKLVLYAPNQQDPARDQLDFRGQDNKTDFQKQNIQNFITTDTTLVRGLVTAGNWTGPFLRLSYRGGPDSKLSQAANHQLGDRIKLYLNVQGRATAEPISVIYNQATDCYDAELWGYEGGYEDLLHDLDDKGKAALQSGQLQIRPDLIQGHPSDFKRETVDSQNMFNVASQSDIHPLIPLHIEAAWSDVSGKYWDSQFGANYHYEFNMRLRGWNNYLAVGSSSNPHGGVGSLEYRNLFSNYGQYMGTRELARQLDAWNFDANGRKVDGKRSESFMAVDYMDLHILRPNCSIGIHRHRDNQEAFFLIEGCAYMVTGDWLKHDDRERCLEVRMMQAGDIVLLKNGEMHSLINTTDENIKLLMFGGYD